MNYLLDTVTFLWLTAGEAGSLSRGARRALESKDGSLYLSSASIWEIAIKFARGKLELGLQPAEMILEIRKTGKISFLPIDPEHAAAVADFPFHHNDPFDRLLIAQSKVEKIPVITPDALFRKYGIETIW